VTTFESSHAPQRGDHGPNEGNNMGVVGKVWRGILYLLPVFLWFWAATVAVPQGWMTSVEGRMLAITIFALVMWILEPIPVFATSVVVIFLQVLLISDSALGFLRADADPRLGQLVDAKELFHSFAAPVIMLFLGGFFLSAGATKYSLDKNLARVFLRPFGQRVDTVLLGLMLISAFFSMWMANTPVTAMMLAIAAPVLGLFDEDDPGRVAILLGVPIATSLGGVGTPVGTPINAIALRYLAAGEDIGFGTWMLVAMPFVLVMLFVSWRILWWMFPANKRQITCDFQGHFDKSAKAIIVYTVFALTIALWLSTAWHGLSIYAVALFPVATFLATGVITRNDMKKMSWDVLWLIAGGIALGVGLESSGLTKTLVAVVPFGALEPWLLIILAAAAGLVVSTIMSHTATANLIMPVVSAVATASAGLAGYGGQRVLIFGVAVAISLGMALPISTPCNALAFAAGNVTNKQMLRAGGTVSILGFVLLCAMLFVLGAFWAH
jgi:sodium-dependent dicarboxylate transporter 2/3/5